MQGSQKHLAEEFQKLGIVFAEVLTDPQAKALADQVLELAKEQPPRIKHITENGQTREISDIVLTTEQLQPIEQIANLYEGLLIYAEHVAGREVVASLDGPSKINAKIHNDAGHTHGWHKEGNSISAILYLTTYNGSGPLLYCHKGEEPQTGKVHRHYPAAGQMAWVEGRKVWHMVPPSKTARQERIVLVFNYYYPGEQELRSSNQDAALYGEDIETTLTDNKTAAADDEEKND